MAEKSLYRTVTVPTLATPEMMWSLPEDRIKDALFSQLPGIHSIAYNWFSARPSMEDAFGGLSDGRHYYRSDSTRQTDMVRYAADESLELLKAVHTHQDPSKVKLELGDTLFWLLLFDQSLNRRVHISTSQFVNDVPKVVLGSEIFKHEISLDDKAEMGVFCGEEAVVQSVGLLSRQMANDANRHLGRERIYAYLDFSISTLYRYAISQNWNLSEIITQVAEKNDRNYPKELFNRMSPFAYDIDAVDFLNLLRRPDRKRSYFADLIDELFPEIKTCSYLPGKPSKELVQRYRETIRNLLVDVYKKADNGFDKERAVFLVRAGRWNEILLK